MRILGTILKEITVIIFGVVQAIFRLQRLEKIGAVEKLREKSMEELLKKSLPKFPVKLGNIEEVS